MPDIKEIPIKQLQSLHKENTGFIDFNLFMYQYCNEFLGIVQQVNVTERGKVKYYFTTGRAYFDMRKPNKIADEL